MTAAQPYSAIPLPWRFETPLHRRFGPRSMHFVYPGGSGLPPATTPAILQLQFANTESFDRIVSYSLSIGACAVDANFVIEDLTTGWRQSYTYSGASFASRGLFMVNLVETHPDTCNLTWSFDGALTGDVVLTFYNIELLPFVSA